MHRNQSFPARALTLLTFASFLAVFSPAVFTSTSSSMVTARGHHMRARHDGDLSARGLLPVSPPFKTTTTTTSTSSSSTSSSRTTTSSSSSTIPPSHSTSTSTSTSTTTSQAPSSTSTSDSITTSTTASSTSATVVTTFTTSSTASTSTSSTPSTTSTSSTTSVVLVPATTFTPDYTATTVIGPVSTDDGASSPTSSAAGSISTGQNDSTKSGFLANKGAMGGVFTVVALLILAGGFALFVFIQRKRRQRRYAQQDQYFEKFDPDNTLPKREDLMSMDFGGEHGMGPSSSSGMAAATAVGAETSGNREPTYPRMDDPYGIDRMQDYGLSYPPGTQPTYNPMDYTYTGQGNYPQSGGQGQDHQGLQQYQPEQYYDPNQYSQQAQYQPPSQNASASSSGNNLAPPPSSYAAGGAGAQHPGNVRQYEHSVDSFYGAGAQNRSSGAAAV